MSCKDAIKRQAATGKTLWMAVLLSIVVGSASAWAGSMSVWPLRVKLTPGEHIRQVHVTNESDEPAYMQATIAKWWTAETGQQSQSVNEIIAVPPVFDLEPGETQIVRLAYRNPDKADVERAFRLEIMEVPKTVGLLPNTAVIATRLVLPVFYSPNGTTPTPVWGLRREPLKEPELVLENRGTAHIGIKSVEVVSQQDETLHFSNDDNDIILPAKEKTWMLGAEFARIDGPIVVKAETNAGPIEAVISPPGG